MRIPADALAVLTPALLAVLMAAMAAVGAWFKMKTRQWERMTEEARISAAEARAFSEGNRQLLEDSKEHIRVLEEQSNGMNAELRSIAATTAFAAGRLAGKLEKEGNINDDELQKMEDEFKGALEQTKNSKGINPK